MTEAREHGRPSRETPLTFEGVPRSSHAESSRTLMARFRTGTLSTLNGEGFPHGSFVSYAMVGPDPVFLVSKLATHTKHLDVDSRASLMVAEPQEDRPLASSRVTIIGPCERTEDVEVREAFLQRHPEASYYVDFSDFGFFRLRSESARYIGGFGRMSWLTIEDYRSAEPDPLHEAEAGIVSHMNEDHADAVLAIVRAFTRATEAEVAYMVNVDRYGCDFSVETSGGMRPARVGFEKALNSADMARAAVVALTKKARTKLAGADD